MAIEETDDQRNERLREEFYQRPDAEKLERELNMEFGEDPVRPRPCRPPRSRMTGRRKCARRPAQKSPSNLGKSPWS